MAKKKIVTREKEEETPAKKGFSKSLKKAISGGGGGMSKADLFNKAKAPGQVAQGKYEGVIKTMVLQDADKEKGQSVRSEFLVCSEGDEQGNVVTQWSKLFEPEDDDGNTTPCKGLEFLKRDLAILGYDDVEFDDLKDCFEEIVEEKIPIVFQVKHKDGFINAYLQGRCEDSEVVKDYLANNPY